jgi:hypothetical protein
MGRLYNSARYTHKRSFFDHPRSFSLPFGFLTTIQDLPILQHRTLSLSSESIYEVCVTARLSFKSLTFLQGSNKILPDHPSSKYRPFLSLSFSLSLPMSASKVKKTVYYQSSLSIRRIPRTAAGKPAQCNGQWAMKWTRAKPNAPEKSDIPSFLERHHRRRTVLPNLYIYPLLLLRLHQRALHTVSVHAYPTYEPA